MSARYTVKPKADRDIDNYSDYLAREANVDVARRFLAAGDILEAKVERGKLTYSPKTVLDRVPANKAERQRFFKQLREEAPAWLKAGWEDAKRKGVDKLTMRQINAEIAAYRREQAKKKIKQPTR